MYRRDCCRNNQNEKAPPPLTTLNNPVAQQMPSARRSRALVICDMCSEETRDYITNPCGHVLCWPCISKYRTASSASSSSRSNCPTCYFNKPLKLISVDKTGHLLLEESAVETCFLECDDRPVYVISVVGERRTGKSFLMNYLMRVLRNLEKNREFSLGGENKSLNGFPWMPGPDQVTGGIWIWGKPFLLENNGQKMAVFLLDTEGTKNTTYHEPASIKLLVLTMMISSHLVYNVNANVKETDIDYLEIYCDPSGKDPFHPFCALKYFDVLVRDRHDGEACGAEFAKSYIIEQIQNLGRRDMKGVLNMVEERTARCFLMPHPGNDIAEGEKGRLREMDEDFQINLRKYLLDVVERTQNCSSDMTCRKMATKLQVCVEYVQKERYFSRPLELCNRLKSQADDKTEKEMKRMKEEFQNFLRNQTLWKLPNQMSTLVSQKLTAIITKFQELPLLTRHEHHQELVVALLIQLEEEGYQFCESHKNDLKYNGIKVAVQVGLAAAATAAFPLLLPAAAPVAAAAAGAGGWFSGVGGWFSAAPAATVSSSVMGMATGGVAMLRAGAGFVLRRFL